jgi:hypothetical protein
MANPTDDATIAALSPSHIGAYLRMRGWEDRGPFGANGRLYARALRDNTLELVLPTRTSITDFTKRMAELVGDLARAEQRPVSNVLFDLTLTPFDVIRIRSKDADEYGSVRFSEGLVLCEEARNILIASARAASADVPRKAWKGRRPETVNDYLQHVRLGQTEKRSFSLTVLSPYAFEPGRSQASLFDRDAFGRRITKQFANALKAVEAALVEGVSNPIPAFEKTVQAGVSAELCEALGNLADNELGVEVSVSWSPAKPIPISVGLSLTPRDAAVLKEVAREFASEEPEPDAQIEGIVTEISEDPRTFDGSTTIEAAIEGRLRRVRVQFDPSDRDVLIEAFRQRSPIRVQGELSSDNNRLNLRNPRGLTIRGVLAPASWITVPRID